MNTINYLFIGGGNMAKAIIQGMNNSSNTNDSFHSTAEISEISINTKHNIYVVDKNEHTHAELQKLSCTIFNNIENTKDILQYIDCIVLAIKPQDSLNVMQELLSILHQNKAKSDLLVISIMAGISIKTITNYLNYACVRCMPNTPLLVNMGASALVGFAISAQHQKIANDMFASSGITSWLDDEEKLHTVTALSGGAPAYVFYILKAMQDFATEMGLEQDIARKLISQTFGGAAQMALNMDKDLIDMQKAVMSKGGTTEQAINGFEENKLDEIIKSSLTKAYKRSTEL
jgi:pyrroline-5-carboxylate reductase